MGDRDELDRLLASASNRVAGATVLRLDDFALQRGAVAPVDEPRFELANLTGRITEASAVGPSAVLTCMAGLVVETQASGQPAAWIAVGDSTFYPPDFAEAGVDLDALVVVKVPGMVAGSRAAERLLRSGAFALVVVDASGQESTGKAIAADAVPLGHLGRLHALAQQHDAAVVVLTSKTERAPSLGSIISLRIAATRTGGAGKPYGYNVDATKDKKRGPWAQEVGELRPPAGLK
jgi:recombination protein RecA